MNMKVFDYKCPRCEREHERVYVTKDEEDKQFCGECSTPDESVKLEKLIGGSTTFKKIIPTYPGSQKLKAGYVHKHVNRPATKTQVGVGGGVTKGDG